MARRWNRRHAWRRHLGQYLGQQPEVINYQIYAGTSGPYNFNGLVRHYFLRNQPNQADIQVNLLSRHDRKAQSHEIARRLRPELDKIAAPFGARIKVAEVPPGPPVLQTLVAEVYGPDYKGQIELAAQDQEDLPADARCRGCGLVRRRPAKQVRHESGSGQGSAARHLSRRCDAHAAGGA